MPRPRKFKPAAKTITGPMMLKQYASGADATLRMSWMRTIETSFTPLARAASMYSWLHAEMVALSVTRATLGTRTTASAMITLRVPGPRVTAIPIASSTAGNAKRTSTHRMITVRVKRPA